MSSGGSEVARVPTPLRVTHASDCTGATMRVQLNTTVGGNLDVEGYLDVGGNLDVELNTTVGGTLDVDGNLDVAGSLSVGGVDVGSNLASSPTWVYMDSSILASGVNGYGVQPYYTVMHGMVFMHGCVAPSGWTGFNSMGMTVATMPPGTRPYGGWHVFLVAGQEGSPCPIQITASNGIIQTKAAYCSLVCFDGVHYRADVDSIWG